MAMDERTRASYLRRVELTRPSRSVLVATVVTGGVLAVGGFVLGHQSDDRAAPASVPLTFGPRPASTGEIIVPSRVTLPGP